MQYLPMDPLKKREVVELIIEASHIRRWLWFFLGLGMVCAIVRVLGIDSILVTVAHAGSLIVAWRCYVRCKKLLDKATDIVVEEANKYHENL